jgi:hypothetical protein
MDISYFQEDISVLLTDAVLTEEGALVSPAVWGIEIVTRHRCQSVSHDAVMRVVKKSMGKSTKVIDRFLALHLETLQWAWYDLYQEHLLAVDLRDERNVAIIEANLLRLPEDQVALLPADEVIPPRPFMDTVEGWRTRNYATLRSTAYLPVEKQLEMLYDDQLNGTTRFKDHVDAVKASHPKPVN